MNTPIIENIIANKVPQKAFVPFLQWGIISTYEKTFPNNSIPPADAVCD